MLEKSCGRVFFRQFFFENPPRKPMPPMGHLPPLKNNPLEKAQIATSNLAKILEKYVWRSSFLANLEACRLIASNFSIKWTPSQAVFDSILSSSHASLMFWFKPPPPSNFEDPPPRSQHQWETLCGVVKSYWCHIEKILFIEKIVMSHNKKYYVKSLKRNKVKSSDIRGLWKKKKIFRRKYSVDTLTHNATVRSSHRKWVFDKN